MSSGVRSDLNSCQRLTLRPGPPNSKFAKSICFTILNRSGLGDVALVRLCETSDPQGGNVGNIKP